jgi:hypothetical protein
VRIRNGLVVVRGLAELVPRFHVGRIAADQLVYDPACPAIVAVLVGAVERDELLQPWRQRSTRSLGSHHVPATNRRVSSLNGPPGDVAQPQVCEREVGIDRDRTIEVRLGAIGLEALQRRRSGEVRAIGLERRRGLGQERRTLSRRRTVGPENQRG